MSRSPRPKATKSQAAQIQLLAAMLNKGDISQAERGARALVNSYPNNGKAWHILGISFYSRSALGPAQEALQRSAQLDPGDGEVWLHLGQCLSGRGQDREALAALKRAMALLPGDIRPWLHAVDVAIKASDLGQVERYALGALRIDPGNVIALNNLGFCLFMQGRHADALAPLQEALRLKPDHVSAWLTYGRCLLAEGRYLDSLRYLRAAQDLAPRSSEPYYFLGVAQLRLRDPGAAVSQFKAAEARGANFPAFLSDMGSAYYDLGDYVSAETYYRRALDLDPNFPPAWVGQALLALNRQDFDAANENYLKAALGAPNAPEVLYGLGMMGFITGDIDLAIKYFQQSSSIDPNYFPGHSGVLFALNYHPTMSAEAIFAAYRDFGVAHTLPKFPPLDASALLVGSGRRLRIGYVSGDFRRHSVRYFLEPLLSSHNRAEFELVAYSTNRLVDEYTRVFRALVDEWVSVADFDDHQFAQRIRADHIDILVDLSGHTADNRLLAFAYKPAPVSVTWLGFGYTTGLPSIDWFLTDATTTPIGCEHLFAEVPWRLPVVALAFRPDPTSRVPGELPALNNGYVTFGSLSRSIRFNDRVLCVWARILSRLPSARLRLDSGSFSSEFVCRHVRSRFEAMGGDSSRLLIGSNSPASGVLQEIDVSLDCFPHNSGTTLIESLHMGVPYVTLASRPSVGRLGSAILEAVGHSEWVSRTEDEYVEKAVALALDIQSLALIRQTLRQELQDSSLMDEAGFARHVEGAYREMWRMYCDRILKP